MTILDQEMFYYKKNNGGWRVFDGEKSVAG
jgi:hypothetical protein